MATPATARSSRRRAARLVMLVHRWLGIALGGLVVAWFLSGFVLLWHGMPELEDQDRLERLPPLDLETVRVAPGEALEILGLEASALTVGTLRSRPVYRMTARGRPVTVFADTGSVFQGMSRADALEVATAHLGRDEHPWSHDRLERPDQWTLQSRTLLPMHRFAFDDGRASVVYVSERTGRVELVTDRADRRWAWLGPVVHWVYFAPVRRHSQLWLRGMIYGSVAGVVLTSTGLGWGVWTWWRRRRSPYRGWVRWHHSTGLVFGLFAFTWMLSGLLSLDPWSWHPGTSPTPAQRRAVRGGPPDLSTVSIGRLRAALGELAAIERPRELELGSFDGHAYALTRSTRDPAQRRLAWLEEPGLPAPPDELRRRLISAAARALPTTDVVGAELLGRGDAYYYRRSYEAPGRRPFPVFRVRFVDRARTALYLDPLTGELLHREQRSTRINRWLYHGLHSWDHPALLQRPAARLALMIALLSGGLAAAGSALVPGVRRAADLVTRRSRSTPEGRR